MLKMKVMQQQMDSIGAGTPYLKNDTHSNLTGFVPNGSRNMTLGRGSEMSNALIRPAMDQINSEIL